VEPSEELREVAIRLIEAVQQGDSDAVRARISHLPGLLMWGSDPDEVVVGGDEAGRLWAQQFVEMGGGYPWTDIGEIHAHREGTMGWAAFDLVWQTPTGPRDFRISWVFHLEHGDWRVVHIHASVPVPNEEALGIVVTTHLDDVAEAVRDERPDLSGETSPDGTVTIVFTDIEDSTRLTQALGDRAWLEILRAHNDLVCSQTAEHGGTVVKGAGDGYMLAFSSARRALACSVAIQRGIAETFDDPGSPIKVRIGVHTGEVLKDADDFYGTAVNQAARVASAASGGQIFTSGLVRALVEGDHDLVFRDGPEVEMKGLAGTHRLHELKWA